MKIIDRYILVRFLSTFVFILGVIMAIAIIFDVSEQIDELIKNEAPVGKTLTHYYLNFILFYGNLFSPLLVFLSVIFFTSQLASRTEIVAMLSAGISFYRLMLPYFIGATLLASVAFVMNNYLVPRANAVRIEFENQYIHTFKRLVDQRIHKQVQPNVHIYFDKFNLASNTGYQFTVEQWQSGALKSKLTAALVKWDSIDSTWTVENYHKRIFRESGEHLVLGEKLDTHFLFTPDEFAGRLEEIQVMDVNELDEYIARETMKGSSNIPYYLIEKHSRNALPFSTYILTAIGVALSSRKVRGGLGAHIAMGLALAVTYILAMKVTTVYATNAGFNPLLAVWLPNILYAALALWLFMRAPK